MSRVALIYVTNVSMNDSNAFAPLCNLISHSEGFLDRVSDLGSSILAF